MNKRELVDGIAKDSGLTRTDAGRALDAFTGVVSRSLKKGEPVAITGLEGSLWSSARPVTAAIRRPGRP